MLLGAEASSIMSGSSSLSSMSTPANTVVETYHAPDGGYGWVRFLTEFRPEKPDCFVFFSELFKNSTTICSSDKIPTGEVDK